MQYFDESRTQVVTWLMHNRPWDLVSFVIKTPDTTQHEIWHLLDPQHPRHDAAMAARVKDDILAYFQAMDACVGKLVEAAGPETTVIVMSDHGGGPFEKFFHVNNWLASQGFLKFKRTPLSLIKRALFAAGFTPITALKIVNLLRLGKLRKNVKRGRGRGWMGQLFLSLRDVDWTRTLAFSIGNFGQIYINTKGARPQGIVEPGAEYETVRDKIIQQALALRDLESGDAVIRATYKREELYHGGRLNHAPDIILHTNRSKYVSFGHADFGSNKLIEPSIGQTGHHTMEGIVILHGADIPAGIRVEGANIMDIAPTVLALMGLDVPGEMDGKVLFGSEIRKQVDRETRETGAIPIAPTDENPYSEEDEDQVMERLRELGYVA